MVDINPIMGTSSAHIFIRNSHMTRAPWYCTDASTIPWHYATSHYISCVSTWWNQWRMSVNNSIH